MKPTGLPNMQCGTSPVLGPFVWQAGSLGSSTPVSEKTYQAPAQQIPKCRVQSVTFGLLRAIPRGPVELVTVAHERGPIMTDTKTIDPMPRWPATKCGWPCAARLLAAVWFAAGLCGCGGGSGAPPSLSSIAVTPSSASIPQGMTQQFKATGTYSDNSTQDLTAAATWTSSATNVVTIG